MTQRPKEAGRGVLPADTAALYAQAQMKPARYGDFTASRRQVRRQFGQRQKSQAPAARVAPLNLPQPTPEPEIVREPEPMQQSPTRDPLELEQAPLQEPQPSNEPRQSSIVPQPPRRWYALRSVLFPSQTFADASPVVEFKNGFYPPAVVVVSSAGGAGKTCLVATVGRALAGVGEQVLLVDRSPFGLLPFYFASREIKPGVVRTFASPAQLGQYDASVRVLTLESDMSGQESEQDGLSDRLLQHVRGASRLLLDSGTVWRGVPRSLQILRPTVLAPILPDMSSLASLRSLESLVGAGAEIFYVLNQFDPSLPLHLDVRAMLQQQLGARLLPMVLHRSPAVSEALADGMTVIDYAPRSEIAEDYRQLAAWLRSVAAPAQVSNGSLRWTER